MTVAQTIGKNIDSIKNQFGLSNEKLGELLGVTRQTVSKYISGEQVIDSAKLFKLATYCNLPVRHFLESHDHKLSFMFRADNPKENFEDRLAMKINGKLVAYCDLLRTYDARDDIYLPASHRLFTSSDKKLSVEEKSKIEEIANKVRRSFEFDDELDIYRALEKQGITVYAMKLDANLDALSAYSEEHGAFILINDRANIPEERKRFSCAHELGHLILHRDDYKLTTEELGYTTSRTDIREKMANAFASYFLIPRSPLRKEYRNVIGKRRNIELRDIVELKSRFGVSAQALILALLEEKLITAPTYGFLKSQIESRFGNQEPRPMQAIMKNGKLNDLLRNLLIEGEITINKIAELLDLSVIDTRIFVKTWVNSDSMQDNQ